MLATDLGKGMWICSVSNHERTSHRHASNRKRPQIHCPQDLYLLLSHDRENLPIILQIIQIIHLQFRQETSGSVHLLPVPCALSQSPGKPSFCDLPLGVHMHLGQLRGATITGR